jgi:hypothetical protein
MNTTGSAQSVSPSRVRWFYSAASLSLLVLMFIGFQLFYLQGMAYPGRPLTPPIRTLLIVHGCLMTAWMLLSVAQPLLVGTKRVRWHMRLGILGVVLAAGIVIVGVKVGIEAARFTPPDFLLFGLTPKEFLTVPVLGILMFGLFVLVGVLNRHRPLVHRPTMFLASVSVIAAALGRMGPLNALFAGTLWEQLFGAFFTSVILAAIYLLLKCLLSKSFDRWFAVGFATFTAACAAITLIAKTAAWDRFATFVLQ